MIFLLLPSLPLQEILILSLIDPNCTATYFSAIHITHCRLSLLVYRGGQLDTQAP